MPLPYPANLSLPHFPLRFHDLNVVLTFCSLLSDVSIHTSRDNNNNNIFILYSAKSMYSSKRFTIKRCDIASLKVIRNVKCAINIQYSG